MKKEFVLYIDEIQPTKPCLDSEKIQKLKNENSEQKLECSVSVKIINEEITLIRGHEEVYAMMLEGMKKVSVCWEENLGDVKYYEYCIKSCQKNNIKTIHDLESRIFDHYNYEKELEILKKGYLD